MTQKQTDYDKALINAYNMEVSVHGGNHVESKEDIPMVFCEGFAHGYNYRDRIVQLGQTDHERNLIALGDDYMTARERAKEEGYNKWLDSDADYDTLDAYEQGWNDADSFDEEWTDKHPEVLRERLDDHPEIIEDEVRARMADIRKEAKENEDAFASASDNMSQNPTIRDIRSDKSLIRAEFAKAAMQGLLSNHKEFESVRNYNPYYVERTLAERTVKYADALIKELEKPTEP